MDKTDFRQRVLRLFPGVIISQLTSMILGTVNTMMAGHINSEVLSGVGNADTALLVIIAFFDGYTYGGSALTGRYLAQRNGRAASQAAAGSLIMGLSFGIPLSFLLFFFRAPIMQTIYSTAMASVINASCDYLTFAAFSIPAAFLFSQLSGILRSAGDSVSPMLAGLSANIVNLVVGAHLILGFFGAERLGASGAGITLLAARISSILVLLVSAFFRNSFQKFLSVGIRNLSCHLLEINRIGFPSSLETSAFYISRLVLQVIIAMMGTSANASYLVFQSSVSLYSLIVDAYAIVIFHVTANYSGVGSRKDCQLFAKRAIKLGFLLSACISVLILFTKQFIPYIYTSSDEISNTVSLMLLALSYTMLIWPWTWLLPSIFRGTGDVRYSTIVNIVCTWSFRIAGTFILARYFGIGVFSVPIAIAIDCTVRAFLYYPYYQKSCWLKYICN